MNWLKQNWYKYLPDALINIGVWIFSYYSFIPTKKSGLILPSLTTTDYHVLERMIGVVLVTLGVNVIIRRYFNKKSRH